MPSNAVPAVKLLLSVVWLLEPKTNASPACGGALPPVQSVEFQLTPAGLLLHVSVAADATLAAEKDRTTAVRDNETAAICGGFLIIMTNRGFLAKVPVRLRHIG